jgi:hypothetical protein
VCRYNIRTSRGPLFARAMQVMQAMLSCRGSALPKTFKENVDWSHGNVSKCQMRKHLELRKYTSMSGFTMPNLISIHPPTYSCISSNVNNGHGKSPSQQPHFASEGRGSQRGVEITELKGFKVNWLLKFRPEIHSHSLTTFINKHSA